MQFTFFYPNDTQNILRKNIDFVDSRGRAVMFFVSLSRNMYENRYVIHAFSTISFPYIS